MAFTPKDWRNEPDHTTPISAAALEDLEQRVYDAAVADAIGVGGGGGMGLSVLAVGDGVADDTAAIQDALDAGAGTVFLPIGRYLITTHLVIPSDTELIGAGWGSQLLFGPSIDLYPLWIQAGTHDVRLADFSIDGNQSNITGDPLVPGDPACAIIADGFTGPCERIFIDRLRIFDQKRMGVVFQSVQTGAVRDCVIEDGGRDGITLFYACRNVVISRNTVRAVGDDYIAMGSGDSAASTDLPQNIVVSENTLLGPGSNNRGPGIQVRGGAGIAIANNTIKDVSQSGIIIRDYNTTPASDITIVGNTIDRPGQGGSADKSGIWVNSNNAADHPTGGTAYVRRITVVGNTIRATPETGILLRDDRPTPLADSLRDILIADNSIEDSGGQGILIPGNATSDVTIRGNRIKGSASHQIDVTGGDRIVVEGNVVYRGLSRGINIAGVEGGAIANNEIYDDRGGSATQTHGVVIGVLAGRFYIAGNHIWGNLDDFLNNGAHTAIFDAGFPGFFPTVASADSIALVKGADVQVVSGSTTITSITGAAAGRTMTLIFTGTAQVTDGSNLALAGNFTGGSGRTLSLVGDGATWYELARSVN